MSDEPAVIYLEPDDEITTVARRLRGTDASRVALVAPGRTKATTSATGLRLLAGLARDEGRQLVLVADPAARSLAAEAGIASAPTVAEARAMRDVTVEPTAPGTAGARISVARGPRRAAPSPSRPPAADLDETRAVPVAAAPPPVTRPRPPRPPRRTASPRWSPAVLGAVALALMAAAVVLGAILLPGATIRISPESRPIGPVAYELVSGTDLELHQASGEEPTRATGTATGLRELRVAATGIVRLQNWNTVAIEVAAGTQVAAGEIVFTTDATVIVPPGGFTPDGRVQAGTETVGVTAVAPGPTGNVAAEAIDRMLTEPTNSLLRGFPNSRLRVVINPEATTGGQAEDLPVVQQADVDAVLATFQAQLAAAVAAAAGSGDPGRIPLDPLDGEQVVDVTVPDDLVGREGETSFELTATLRWTVTWLARDEVEARAAERLLEDPTAVPAGRELDPDSIAVTIDAAARNADGARVPVRVTAASLPAIDIEALKGQLAGLERETAEAILREIGPASIELWPGWVTTVPGIGWRVSVEVGEGVAPGASARASSAP